MQIDYYDGLHELKKTLISSLKDLKLTTQKENFEHKVIISNSSYSPWLTDEKFRELYKKIKNYTLIDEYRCYILWDISSQVKKIQGDILEVGVWRGGSSVLLTNGLSNKDRIYLADTFKGVVKAGENDTRYKGGEHSDTTLELVENLLSKYLLNDQFTILNGIYPDDFSNYNFENGLKLCHIDVDVFESAKNIFDFIWSKMLKGGVVIFDDYGFWGCEGITDFVNRLKMDLKDGIVVYNLSGQALIIKN